MTACSWKGGKALRSGATGWTRDVGGGITLGPGTANVIKRNHLSGGLDGIRIEKGHGNLVAHNTVVHVRGRASASGSALLLGGAHNVIRGNLVKGSRLNGFLVEKKDWHSRLIGNVARGASSNGFEITSPSAMLKNNRAKFNGNLGIRAVRGVKDGGGNVAHHNFDYRQCTGRDRL